MRNTWRFGMIFLMAVLLAACGQAQIQPTDIPLPTLIPSPIPVMTDTPSPTRTIQNTIEATPQGMATVRFVNAAPDVPTFNIFSGSQAIATNLAFGQYTESTPIEATDYTLRLIPTGSGSSATPLLETSFSVKSNDALLVVISGNGDQLSLTPLPDKTEALNAGESIIRVIHAISGAGAVVLRNESGDLTSPVNYGEMALSGIQPAGSSTLTFNSGDTKLVDYSADLKEKTEYTVILAGHPDSPQVISFNTHTPGRSTVRVINASSQVSSVDFYLDDIPLNSQVGFGRPTERQSVTAGEYAVQIYEAGANRSSIKPLTSQTITLEAEQNMALIFLGSKAPFAIVNFAEDISPTPPGQARVAFMNTLDNLPSIQLEASAGPIPGVSDLIYGTPPISTLLDAGSYNFHTDAADQNGDLNTVEVVNNLQFEQGLSYLYLITGRMDNNPIILSENVGTDQNLEDSVDANGTPVVVSAARVRFVNALQDQHAVDFLLNNTPLLPGLPPQQGSDLIAIDDLTPTIQIMIDGGSTPIAELEATLDSNTRYTMIAYGTVPADVRLLLVPDSGLIFDGQSPHIRLINLSPESDIQLGLATADSTQAPDITLPTDATGDRPFVPQGVQKSIDSTSGGSASSVVLMPVGTSNVYIFDSALDEVTAILTSLRLEAGLHYDVFAMQQPGQALSQVFVLTYPVGSG